MFLTLNKLLFNYFFLVGTRVTKFPPVTPLLLQKIAMKWKSFWLFMSTSQITVHNPNNNFPVTPWLSLSLLRPNNGKFNKTNCCKTAANKMPATLALRVMLGLIHLFQLYASPIDKTILANGIVWVTTIALRCFPCVTRLRLSAEICQIPLR